MTRATNIRTALLSGLLVCAPIACSQSLQSDARANPYDIALPLPTCKPSARAGPTTAAVETHERCKDRQNGELYDLQTDTRAISNIAEQGAFD